MANLIKLQLGKNGLTEGFITNVKTAFKEAESVRISVLRSSTRDKNQLEEWTSKIISELGPNFTSKIIGYTIVLRKWRRARASK